MKNETYKAILSMMKEQHASDLYLCPNAKPLFRVKNAFKPVLIDHDLSPAEVEDFIFDTMTEQEREAFVKNKDLDYSLEIDNKYFFRMNAYYANGNAEMVVRALDSEPPNFDKLRLPDNVKWLCENYTDGIIIVAGATGSGKSSTLAAMIDHINRTQQKKIMTLEDPIEIRHRSMRSSVSQREIGKDTLTFENALKAVLRQRPDVILLGEIRDADTMKVSLKAAESGHLVLATLHAGSAEEVVNRILGFYQIAERDSVRGLLAGALKGVVAQRLANDVNGKVIPLVEVLSSTLRIRDAITDGASNDSLKSIIKSSSYDHMQEFDDYIYALMKLGVLSQEEGLKKASDRNELLRRLKYE